jgi:hypothetical protein
MRFFGLEITTCRAHARLVDDLDYCKGKMEELRKEAVMAGNLLCANLIASGRGEGKHRTLTGDQLKAAMPYVIAMIPEGEGIRMMVQSRGTGEK